MVAQRRGGARDLARRLMHAGRCWWEDGATRQGAAIAFYATLSLAPFLLVIATVAAFFVGADEARGYVVTQGGALVGSEGEALLKQLVGSGASSQAKGWAAAIGIGSTLVGATAGFSELQEALNRIFGVAPARGALRSMLRGRLWSLLLVALVALLLVASLGLTALVSRSAGRVLGGQFVDAATMLANEAITMGMAAVLFATVLHVLPDRHVPWRYAFEGAILAAVLFQGAKFGIGWYIGHASGAAAYGATASVVALMLWIYFSAQVFLLGAEFAAAGLRWREQGPHAAAPAPTPESLPTIA